MFSCCEGSIIYFPFTKKGNKAGTIFSCCSVLLTLDLKSRAPNQNTLKEFPALRYLRNLEITVISIWIESDQNNSTITWSHLCQNLGNRAVMGHH